MSSLVVRRGPRRDDPHEVVYFRRHPDDDPAAGAPGREFLRSCPTGVRAKFVAVLVAVAAAPPHRFAGALEVIAATLLGWTSALAPDAGRDNAGSALVASSAIDVARSLA